MITNFNAVYPDFALLHGNFLTYADAALEQMPHARFAQHDTERVFTRDEFVMAFGMDTSHRHHPIKQHFVLKNLLDTDFVDLDAGSRQSLELTAIVHDMGEPFCEEGDTIAGTRIDVDAETIARHKVIRHIAPESAEEIIAQTEPILSDPDQQGHAIFAVSERIGYILTGGTVARKFLNRRSEFLNHPQRTVAGVIATDIYFRTLPKLRKLEGTHRYVDLALYQSAGNIEVAASQFRSEQPVIFAAAKEKATSR